MDQLESAGSPPVLQSSLFPAESVHGLVSGTLICALLLNDCAIRSMYGICKSARKPIPPVTDKVKTFSCSRPSAVSFIASDFSSPQCLFSLGLFAGTYGFTTGTGGLAYLGLGVGFIAGKYDCTHGLIYCYSSRR